MVVLFGKKKLKEEIKALKQENRALKEKLADKNEEISEVKQALNNKAQTNEQLYTLKQKVQQSVEEMKDEDNWIIGQVNDINNKANLVLEENKIEEDIISNMKIDLESSKEELEDFYNLFVDLHNEINNIAKFVEKIRKIADQTNMLALNASIEAARANKSGAGFAIVAQEIKDLSLRTSDLLEDIISSTRNIYNLLSKSKDSINSLNLHLDDNRKIAHKLDSHFVNVMDLISEIFTMVSQINQAGEEHLDLGDSIIKIVK
ncbi:methyl-accepting chemotaxis protein [Orenia marismortui]|uniref:methyl-accepting chemotaxis protein n=1 Tax=Orenia marismortui TaxID=46469 RepID=UPI001FB9EC45|nr:methyl-accepting chemotaxis protein [Orenia marismortui]